MSICGLDTDLMASCESEVVRDRSIGDKIGNEELIAMINQMCEGPTAVVSPNSSSPAMQKENTSLKQSATICGTSSPASCSTDSSWHACPASMCNVHLFE